MHQKKLPVRADFPPSHRCKKNQSKTAMTAIYNFDARCQYSSTCRYNRNRSGGYTPCEPRGHFVSNIALRCAHGAICARSLECEHSDSASLDYVASGSTGRAVSSSRLNGATTKRGNRKGCLFLLVEQVFRKSNH